MKAETSVHNKQEKKRNGNEKNIKQNGINWKANKKLCSLFVNGNSIAERRQTRMINCGLEKLSQLDVKLDYPRQAFYHLSSSCCSHNINRRDINKVIFDISSHLRMIRRCETSFINFIMPFPNIPFEGTLRTRNWFNPLSINCF